jgi:hypothetical protein
MSVEYRRGGAIPGICAHLPRFLPRPPYAASLHAYLLHRACGLREAAFTSHKLRSYTPRGTGPHLI